MIILGHLSREAVLFLEGSLDSTVHTLNLFDLREENSLSIVATCPLFGCSTLVSSILTLIPKPPAPLEGR